MINADGRYEDIHTGGDGYWGCYEQFYHKQGSQNICDAVIINIAIPESETFAGMEQLTHYFFEDVQEVDMEEKKRKKEGPER